MTVSAIDTAAQLVAAYDKPSSFLWFERKADGKISLNETGLSYTSANPNAQFVQDLNSLSPKEFKAAADKMRNDAVKGYLYNKYPDFFRRWDRAAADSGSTAESSAMCGYIDFRAFWPARNRTIEAFLSDLKQTVTAPRDLALFSQCNLYGGITGFRSEMLRNSIDSAKYEAQLAAKDARIEMLERKVANIPVIEPENRTGGYGHAGYVDDVLY